MFALMPAFALGASAAANDEVRNPDDGRRPARIRRHFQLQPERRIRNVGRRARRDRRRVRSGRRRIGGTQYRYSGIQRMCPARSGGRTAYGRDGRIHPTGERIRSKPVVTERTFVFGQPHSRNNKRRHRHCSERPTKQRNTEHARPRISRSGCASRRAGLRHRNTTGQQSSSPVTIPGST